MTAADGLGATSLSSEVSLYDERRNNNNRLTSRMGEQVPLVCIGIAVGVIALLVVILVPLSFGGVEYYEFGFLRRKTTGSVDITKVYTTGLHLIGPDYEFKKFDADAHFETFKTVTIFAADRLQVSLSCHFQYFLRERELAELHKKYDIYYRPILRSNAMDALKGAATQFQTREYIRDRNKIEEALFKAVKERLGGKCCEPGCEKKGTCTPGCLTKSQCSVDKKGLHADVRYFQLTKVNIPDELNQRYLQALILQEDTETEKLKQQAHIIRKETEAEVRQIGNEAAEISQNGTALSQLIVSKANANARSVVEGARSEGLLHLYKGLEISNPKHRTSLDYLRSLRGKKGISFAVGYDTLVAGPMKDFDTHRGK